MSDAQIVEMYLSGVDSMTVGLTARCDAQTVLKLVRAAGFQTRSRGGVKKNKASSLPMEQAARLYNAGLSVQEVADKCGLDRATMTNRLKAFGVEIRSLPEVARLKARQGRRFGRPPHHDKP